MLARHEQAAAGMAAAYAQLTGEPAVCVATASPGATNLVSGIAQTSAGSLPVIVLNGRGRSATAHRGASQEVPTDRVFAPITEYAVRVDRADLLVDVLRQAIAIRRSGGESAGARLCSTSPWPGSGCGRPSSTTGSTRPASPAMPEGPAGSKDAVQRGPVLGRQRPSPVHGG